MIRRHSHALDPGRASQKHDPSDGGGPLPLFESDSSASRILNPAAVASVVYQLPEDEMERLVEYVRGSSLETDYLQRVTRWIAERHPELLKRVNLIQGAELLREALREELRNG